MKAAYFDPNIPTGDVTERSAWANIIQTGRCTSALGA
jgi:hypothetical protein